MRTIVQRLAIAACASALAVGCATPSKDHYYWGNYEPLILTMYTEPGTADPLTQIEALTSDIQQAANNGKLVPPGLYAHLGMMYAMSGDIALAEEAFMQEKALFPEAAHFINGMMQRARDNYHDAIAPAK